MGHFQGGDNRGGGFRGGDRGGRPSFQKKSWGSDRGNDREKIMHTATCSECKQSCQVPFRPLGDKPVYCTACFQKRGGDDRAPRADFGNHERKPWNDRPAPRADFARPEFKPAPAVAVANDDMKKQFAEINTKLDRLINVIEKMNTIQKSMPVSAPTPDDEKKEAVKSAPEKAVKKKVVAKKKK